MHHHLYTDALKEAADFANILGEPVRIITFDYVPFFENEEACRMFALTNDTCTLEEMWNAGYRNPNIEKTVMPNETTPEAVEAYQRGY